MRSRGEKVALTEKIYERSTETYGSPRV